MGKAAVGFTSFVAKAVLTHLCSVAQGQLPPTMQVHAVCLLNLHHHLLLQMKMIGALGMHSLHPKGRRQSRQRRLCPPLGKQPLLLYVDTLCSGWPKLRRTPVRLHPSVSASGFGHASAQALQLHSSHTCTLLLLLTSSASLLLCNSALPTLILTAQYRSCSSLFICQSVNAKVYTCKDVTVILPLASMLSSP